MKLFIFIFIFSFSQLDAKETCYLIVSSTDDNILKYEKLSFILAKKYLGDINKIPIDGIKTNHNCVYEIYFIYDKNNLLVTVTGNKINSYGESSIKENSYIQKALLKSFHRGIKSKREHICEEYGNLIEQCHLNKTKSIKKRKLKSIHYDLTNKNITFSSNNLSIRKYKNGKFKYIGFIKNGLSNGSGSEYWINGNIKYRGSWSKGLYHGIGRLYDENGEQKFKGKFIEGKPVNIQEKSIIKKIYFENGTLKYVGYLKDNLYHGQGTEFHINGKVKYRGKWLNGKHSGKGTLYDVDGNIIHKGEFLFGEMN